MHKKRVSVCVESVKPSEYVKTFKPRNDLQIPKEQLLSLIHPPDKRKARKALSVAFRAKLFRLQQEEATRNGCRVYSDINDQQFGFKLPELPSAELHKTFK